MNTTREAYKAKMEAQLALWSARLAGLKAKVDEAGADARIDLRDRAADLERFEATAKEHIAAVEASAAENWQKVQGGIEKTWDRLSGSVEALWARVMPEKH